MKPLPQGEFAVLLVNLDDNASHDISVSFSELGISGSFTAINIWTNDSSKVQNSISVTGVASHASYFFKLTPA